MDGLAGDQLKRYVQRIAGDIGPRPAGHPAEAQARAVIGEIPTQAGITEVEELTFQTPDTWGYGTITPLLLALAGNLIAPVSGLLSAGIAAASGYQFWQATTGQMLKQPLYRLYPQRQGGTVIARLPPASDIRQQVVLVGHVDSNKHRLTFSPLFKRSLRLSTTSLAAAIAINGFAALFGFHDLRWLSAGYLAFGTGMMLVDEMGPFVDGANDNASAVACLLGIGQQAQLKPLQHTEIWLAFTGAEEVSHNGLHALLDRYGDELRDAWFIDFEMVGKGHIHYARRQTGLIYGTTYTPDANSLALAEQVAAHHPELNVSAREVDILDEVATLRRRGYHGLCLVGVAEDGFSANWHRDTDTVANIDPLPLEQAARFAWAMVEQLDQNSKVKT